MRRLCSWWPVICFAAWQVPGLLAVACGASSVGSESLSTATCTSAATCTNNINAKDDVLLNSDDSPGPFVRTHEATSRLERILARTPDNDVIARSINLLKDRGAHRCWHKHSVFLDHLVGVADILYLWNPLDDILRFVGLFHSAYSNSYVNLSLLDPATERPLLRDVIGADAEEIVFLFCSIDRQAIVVNTLLRNGFIPEAGLSVRNIRGGDDVYLSAEMLFQLVVFTMADIADQYFGWQDELFGGGGTAGSMIIPGEDVEERHVPSKLWPGVSKPGLWMSYVSQLAQVAATFGNSSNRIPPVFHSGTQLLTVENEAKARDLYWSVVTSQVDGREVETTLQACIQANPWAFEPHVLLAQSLIQSGDFESAAVAATKALDLQHQWGTSWDKRLPFGAWVAWTRVLLQQAQAKEPWPTNSWKVNNLGLVH